MRRFGKPFSSACRKTELCERKEDASDLFFNDSLALQDVQRDEFENIPGFKMPDLALLVSKSHF